jgi:pyruvate/2-oxoglutarate dehydrogenase complex dihydrolipoamide acyltransferase (E2) component
MIDLILSADSWTDIDAEVEALVDTWHVSEGDIVKAGQSLITVVLIKASVDIVAPSAGSIEKILVPSGSTFARGAILGRLQEALST